MGCHCHLSAHHLTSSQRASLLLRNLCSATTPSRKSHHLLINGVWICSFAAVPSLDLEDGGSDMFCEAIWHASADSSTTSAIRIPLSTNFPFSLDRTLIWICEGQATAKGETVATSWSRCPAVHNSAPLAVLKRSRISIRPLNGRIVCFCATGECEIGCTNAGIMHARLADRLV